MADWSNVLKCLFTGSNVRGSIPQWCNEGGGTKGADAPVALFGGATFSAIGVLKMLTHILSHSRVVDRRT